MSRCFPLLSLLALCSCLGTEEPPTDTPSTDTQPFVIQMPAGVTANTPRFSPDGTRLSFDYGEQLNDSLAVVNRDGTNLQVIAPDCSTFCPSAWHPTSGEIFFSTSTEVRAVGSLGGSSRSVYKPFAFSGTNLDVSRDGRFLATSGFDPIVYTFLDGSTQEIPSDDQFYSMRFSPDGQKIVYHDYKTHAIRILDLTTRAATTVLDTDSYLASADWFPDGKRLAVTTEKGLEIVTPQEGTTPTRTVLRSGSALKDVAVSPDGKAIAYCINGQRSISVLTAGF